MGEGKIKPTGRRPELGSLPVRSFIIMDMEAKIMKMAKKFLAVALAGVLALSVLTGCGDSVKSKDIADSLTKMGVKVEQDDGVDATAKETLKAIETIINDTTNAAKPDSDTSKITLDNAVEGHYGKVIKGYSITADAVKKALGVLSTSTVAAEKANVGKQVRVALVKTENATKDASLQAAIAKDALFTAQAPVYTKFADTGKLGSAKTSDGKYILVVIVNDVKAGA